MATAIRLRIFPQSFEHCFKNDHRTGQPVVPRPSLCMFRLGRPGRGDGLCLKQCRSFMSEEGEVSEKKGVVQKARKSRNLKGSEAKLESGSGFWKSLMTTILGGFRLAHGDEYDRAVAKVEKVFSSIAIQIGRYIVTMMSTGVILEIGFLMSGGDSQMDTLVWYSWLGGIIIGTMIGVNMGLEEHCRAGPRNVVITGSSESVDMTVKELKDNLEECMTKAGDSSRRKLQQAKVVGIPCNVCAPGDVQKLANFAVHELGSINIWINNADMNKGFRPLLQFSDEDIRQIVSTNLVGSLLCTREAMQVMKNQYKGGHIFNMDGAGSGGSRGSGGSSTPLTAVGSSVKNKQMFNIICEHPETVARTLVPRMRVVKGTGKAINYLTPPRILLALVTAWLRRDRWFDAQGRALYAAEADRLRNWAENRTRFSFTDAMEMYTENTWVSVFSLSVVCAFIILSTSGSTFHGT
ncbi:probable chlorophyll(ide) b reductase NYC1, chloroplastic isoform X2 [Juglans regia]|uniref:Probable chlorophyll(Ide) b reductase NYC1, chloroplastic isoform X2 n=1 Tax=Juglans regia TaxID=51240 RepID=A0A6P9DUR4_JUGRE|nr:probable chlorophyll(ide) b reductase NYC1, chloroplastic isoform X2 [Juglans regia]